MKKKIQNIKKNLEKCKYKIDKCFFYFFLLICEFYFIYYRSKTTTPAQYEKLVAFMATNTDIAGGFHTRPKETIQAFWEEVRCELNAIGPPSKDVNAWKKECMTF